MGLLATAALILSIAAPDPGCITDASPKQLAARQSPLDSVRADAFGGVIKVCYGRPMVRGRVIFGGLIPYGNIWRAGANEPTIIHTSVPITVAGIRLEPGAYSLYLVPQDGPEWDVVLNRATAQWGIETQYDSIKAQEVARAKVQVSRVSESTERLTVELTGAAIALNWEFVRVNIPLGAAR
jgi:hypothetical protein